MPPGPGVALSRRSSAIVIAVRPIGLTLLVVALGSWAWTRFGVSEWAETPATARSPIASVQQELLDTNLGKAGDPALGARFHDIAVKYFRGSLPPVPVRWEPGLARVGPLAARRFTLEGMF